MGVGGQRHSPAALPPGKTRYPLYRRLGGPQGRSGRVRKISPPPGFDPRTVQPVASRYTDWCTVHKTLNWWDVNCNSSPRRRCFSFIVPLDAFTRVHCTEGSCISRIKFVQHTEDGIEALKFIVYLLLQVQTVVSFKITNFWDVTPCIFVDG